MYLHVVLLVLVSLQSTPNPVTQQLGSNTKGHPLTQVVLTQGTSSVTDAEQRFTAALLKKDVVGFGDLLADDLLHIGFDGQVAHKPEYMAFFKQGVWRYLKYETTDVAVKALGNVAVVTGRVDRTIAINNEETSGAFAFTHVWLQAGGHWRLTSSQLTSIPAGG